MSNRGIASVAIASLICLAGCVSQPSGTGVRWYNPFTWGSATEAKKAEKLESKSIAARENLIKEAQKTAHETSIALEEIPASNAKETAQESNQRTVTYLDQAAGPLTVDQIESIRQQVKLLLSDNADLRRQGEALRQENRESAARQSRELASLQSKLDAANQALPEALRREAAVANKFRNLMFGFWALVVLAVIGLGVSLYLKVMYGGAWGALGKGLSSIYQAHPSEAQNIELLLSKHLNPSVLKKILSHSA